MIELIKVLNPIIVTVVTVFGGASIKFYLDALSLKKKYKLEKEENQILKEEIQDKSLAIQMDLEMLSATNGKTILYLD